MIHQLRVQNYKALRDVTIDLSPIHVLIGPNDSGKTSLLEAIGALCRSVDFPLDAAFIGPWTGRSLVWQGEPHADVAFDLHANDGERRFEYHLACQFADGARVVRVKDESVDLPNVIQTGLGSTGNPTTFVQHFASRRVKPTSAGEEAAGCVYRALTGIRHFHWHPPFLALPVAPTDVSPFRLDASGFGLAQCLDDILSDDRTRFGELEKRFRELFKSVKSLKLKRGPAYQAPPDPTLPAPSFKTAPGKGLYFEMDSPAQELPASQVSEGMLLVLAYLTVLHLPQPPRLLLIDEPENGIHPRRLADVLTILRDLIARQTHTQVVLTTHSPYVVDLFQPAEVTLCRKQADGTVALRRLSESKTVREQMDVFTLGEIWTAEGDEALAMPIEGAAGTAP